MQKVVKYECFGATIVIGTPYISSLLYIIKLLVLLLLLKNLFYLEIGVFLAKYLGFTVWKIGRDGVKRRKGSPASGKTLVWPILSQNLNHTDIELG